MFNIKEYGPYTSIAILIIIIILMCTFAYKNGLRDKNINNNNGVHFDINENIKEKENGVCMKKKFTSHGEKICCKTMSNIYGVDFVNTRPDWLVNPETGRKLELDCYNADLKIAVEYNGEQHYKWPNFTGQTKEQFESQIRRDNIKIETCKKMGIHLIVVPYTVKIKDIPSFIINNLPNTLRDKILENDSIVSLVSKTD